MEFIRQEIATEIWPATNDAKKEEEKEDFRRFTKLVKLSSISGGPNGPTKDLLPSKQALKSRNKMRTGLTT